MHVDVRSLTADATTRLFTGDLQLLACFSDVRLDHLVLLLLLLFLDFGVVVFPMWLKFWCRGAFGYYCLSRLVQCGWVDGASGVLAWLAVEER